MKPRRFPCNEWVSEWVKCGDTAMAQGEQRHHDSCPKAPKTTKPPRTTKYDVK